jgi:hypothetical protein
VISVPNVAPVGHVDFSMLVMNGPCTWTKQCANLGLLKGGKSLFASLFDLIVLAAPACWHPGDFLRGRSDVEDDGRVSGKAGVKPYM